MFLLFAHRLALYLCLYVRDFFSHPSSLSIHFLANPNTNNNILLSGFLQSHGVYIFFIQTVTFYI